MMDSGFERFVSLTGRANKTIQRIKAKKMERYILGSAHTTCICKLEAAGKNGLTQTELVKQEMMNAAHISRVLHDLCAKGYAEPDGNEGAYKRKYHLTELGEYIAAEIRGNIDEITTFVSGDIPPADLEVFYRTLGTISDRLELAEKHFSKRRR